MSRKTLSFIVGGLGIVVAFATLIGISVMGSVLADARSENIAGPGVDVFLLTPFPTPGSEMELEVVARGGSKAGLSSAEVSIDRELVAHKDGPGATWGYTIVDGKDRGSSSETVSFPLPGRVAAGDTLHLDISVRYVVAMSSGAGRFENQSHADLVQLDVVVLSPSGRQLARLERGALALGLLGLWLFFVWGIVYLFTNAEGTGGDPQLEGIAFLMGLVGGGLLGYWFFARPLLAAWESSSTFLAVLLTALWIGLPLWISWRWSKRAPKWQRYRLRGSDRNVEVNASDLTAWLPSAAQRAGELSIKRDKSRLRVRWSGQRFPIDELVIDATDMRLALELAHRAGQKLGRLLLSPNVGPTLMVDPSRTVEEIEQEYVGAMLAEAQRLLSAMRLPRP